VRAAGSASPAKAFRTPARLCLLHVIAGAPNAVTEVTRLIGRAPVMSTAFTMESVQSGGCEQRLRELGDALRITEDAKNRAPPDGLALQPA
jgi:hypothetical protein